MTEQRLIDLDPGSPEATAAGCSCPPPPSPAVPRGARDLDWECPLHGIAAVQHAILGAKPKFNAAGEQLDLNSGEPFSAGEDEDLRWCVSHEKSIDHIAEFLCRTPSEIQQRISELELQTKRSA